MDENLFTVKPNWLKQVQMALKSDNLKKMTENHKNIGNNGRTVQCLPGDVILN